MIDYFFVDDLQIHGAATLSVRKMRGLGSPVPRESVRTHASRHGAIDSTKFYDGRVLEIEGQVLATSPALTWGAFDTLKGKLALGQQRTLRFRRNGLSQDEQISALVSSVVDQQIATENGPVIFYSAAFFAGDPRIYSATLKSGTYDPTASLSGGGADVVTGGGMDFPLVFTTTTATELELTNSGQFKTPPILTVKGPVGNPIIDNDTTGESIYLLYSLGTADTIVVDVAVAGERDGVDGDRVDGPVPRRLDLIA